MTQKTARSLFILAIVPLVIVGSLRSAAVAEHGVSARAAGEATLNLAALKAEARSMAVHIDGP